MAALRESRRRLLLSLPLAAAALQAPGCAWLRGTKRAEPPPLPALSNAASAAPAWSIAAAGRAGVGFQPRFAGASLWTASADGTVIRVDPRDGSTVWRRDVGTRLSAGVGSDGTRAVVAGRDGSVLLLDADGRTRWTVPLGAEVITPPAIAQDVVVVRTGDNRLIALDADDGRRLWTFQRPNPPLVLRQPGGIVIDGASVYAGLPGGRLIALGLHNGAPRWDVAVAVPRGTTEIERIVDVVGPPAVVGNEVYAVSYQGRIGCFDARTGNAVWTREFSSASGLDVDPRLVLAVDVDDIVHALGRDGAPLWKQERLTLRGLSAPLSHGDLVAVGDRGGLVHWLARNDGSPVARAATDGSAIVAAPVLAGQSLVVQTRNGAVYAFDVR